MQLRKAIENLQGGNFIRSTPQTFETASILNNSYATSDFPSEPPSEAPSEAPSEPETPSESEEAPECNRFVFNFKNIQRTSQTSPV